MPGPAIRSLALLALTTNAAAFATNAATHTLTKPTFAKPEPVVATNILALRGGASLGPLTATGGAWLQVILEVYFLSLMSGNLKFLPNLPLMGGDPYVKFGWTESSESKPLMKQFYGAIWYLLAVTFATTYWGDAAAHVNVCRGACLAWAGCAYVFISQYFDGTTAFTESVPLAIVLPLIFAYLGWA